MLHQNGPLLRLLVFTIPVLSVVSLHGQDIEVERSGLIYGLGRVEQVHHGSATIDLGDAHLLRTDDLVALFRHEAGYFVPVGRLRIAETYPTFCRAVRSTRVKPKSDDIVLFVREFSEFKTGRRYMDEFVKRQMIRNSGTNRYSTRRSLDTAMALLSYNRQHSKWEKRSGNVIGYLEGASFANGERENIERLLAHIAMMRELYRVGRNSLPAAGPGWEEVMPVLFGPTVRAQHEAAQSVVTEDDLQAEDTGPGIREVQQIVRDRMFDRLQEERNLISFLIASMLEQPPRRMELWFKDQVGRSIFPELGEEEVVLEQLRDMMRELRDEI